MKAEAIGRFVDHRLVAIQPRHGDTVDGVIAAVGRKWALVHVLTDGRPDGLTALRCSHVYSVRPTGPVDDDLTEELQRLAGLGLDTTAGVLARLSALGETFALHVEHDPVPIVGAITRILPSKKRIEVDVFGHGPRRIRFSSLRRIDVGDHADR